MVVKAQLNVRFNVIPREGVERFFPGAFGFAVARDVIPREGVERQKQISSPKARP